MACFINQRAIFISSYKYTSTTIWNRSNIYFFFLLYYFTIQQYLYLYDSKSPHHIHLTCYKKRNSVRLMMITLEKSFTNDNILPLHQSCLKVDNLSRENILWNGRKIRMRNEENILQKLNQFVVTYAKGSCLTDHVGCNMSFWWIFIVGFAEHNSE